LIHSISNRSDEKIQTFLKYDFTFIEEITKEHKISDKEFIIGIKIGFTKEIVHKNRMYRPLKQISFVTA
jgi:hypothetical protein